MLVVIQWSLEAFHHRPSLQTLAKTVAEHEVVLVCPHRAAEDGVISGLRRALPRCQIVALLVEDAVPVHERELIEELLNEGKLPLILTLRDPPSPALTSWLNADDTIELPGAPRPASSPAASG